MSSSEEDDDLLFSQSLSWEDGEGGEGGKKKKKTTKKKGKKIKDADEDEFVTFEGEDDDEEEEKKKKKKKPKTGFYALGLSYGLLQGIRQQGYRVPTPIQVCHCCLEIYFSNCPFHSLVSPPFISRATLRVFPFIIFNRNNAFL
jgi:hypothetical protein